MARSSSSSTATVVRARDGRSPSTNSTGCRLLFPVDDGSVRVTCDGTDLPRFDNDVSDMRAFAFDAGGRMMAGWPVQLRPGFAGGVVGDELALLASSS